MKQCGLGYKGGLGRLANPVCFCPAPLSEKRDYCSGFSAMLRSVLLGFALAVPIASQQIYDIVSDQSLWTVPCIRRMRSHSYQWSTTWQRDNLFTYKNLGSSPINFVTPGSTGTSDIQVDDTAYYQDIIGFGAALSKLSSYSMSMHMRLTMAPHS